MSVSSSHLICRVPDVVFKYADRIVLILLKLPRGLFGRQGALSAELVGLFVIIITESLPSCSRVRIRLYGHLCAALPISLHDVIAGLGCVLIR